MNKKKNDSVKPNTKRSSCWHSLRRRLRSACLPLYRAAVGRRPTHVASWRVEFEQNLFIQIYPAPPAKRVLYDITRYFVSTPSCIIVGVAPVITYVFFFRQRSEAVKAGAHYKPVAPGCALKTSTMWAVLSALWKTTGSRFAVQLRCTKGR